MHEKIDQQKFNSHQISHYFETPPSSITPKFHHLFQPSISQLASSATYVSGSPMAEIKSLKVTEKETKPPTT